MSHSHLRTFGRLCFPNLSATTPHKLSPRSIAYVFLGYPREHKGYRYLDLSSNKIITSRHVLFLEKKIPLASQHVSSDRPHTSAPTSDSSASSLDLVPIRPGSRIAHEPQIPPRAFQPPPHMHSNNHALTLGPSHCAPHRFCFSRSGLPTC
jgi:hypothetical protein